MLLCDSVCFGHQKVQAVSMTRITTSCPKVMRKKNFPKQIILFLEKNVGFFLKNEKIRKNEFPTGNFGLSRETSDEKMYRMPGGGPKRNVYHGRIHLRGPLEKIWRSLAIYQKITNNLPRFTHELHPLDKVSTQSAPRVKQNVTLVLKGIQIIDLKGRAPASANFTGSERKCHMYMIIPPDIYNTFAQFLQVLSQNLLF